MGRVAALKLVLGILFVGYFIRAAWRRAIKLMKRSSCGDVSADSRSFSCALES